MANFRMANFRLTELFAVAIAIVTMFPSISAAQEDGLPMAIRHWSNGGITVETMSGLTVGVGVKSLMEAKNDASKPQSPIDFYLKDMPENGALIGISRKPNVEKWTTRELALISGGPMQNEIVVAQGQFGPSVSAGAVQMIFVGAMPSDKLLEKAKQGLENARQSKQQLLLVAAGDKFDEEACKKLIDSMAPRILVVNESLKQVGDIKVEKIAHNTIAFSNKLDLDAATRVVSLGTEPYKMSDELKDLFDKKEAACKASREMFAKLSVKQMNFKPSNGSHTPRWNTEHMMGRELLFFSQIYNAVDPTIPVMNLNPKQMPDDYEFAHEDWTGAEEARLTKRVQDFTRRFAYLLDGMDLNKKAKGSRIWTPRALLVQMERHYKEHSANVVKKMELDGWPSENEKK